MRSASRARYPVTAAPGIHACIQALGRGKRGVRDLSAAQAEAAMGAVLVGEATPEQVGALLMLLRVKGETGAEVAGMVRAARAAVVRPPANLALDLDWPCYAGKRRHPPWYLLAVRLLAGNGVRMLLHGVSGQDGGRLYAEDACSAVGIRVCANWEGVAGALADAGAAYLPLAACAPRLAALMALRDQFGLRTPIHTVSRMLNPGRARCSLQSVFHPPYLAVHAAAARVLQEPNVAVFKGEGGEVERDPDRDTEVYGARAGAEEVTQWPALFGGLRHLKPARVEVGALRRLWLAREQDAYGEAAVVGTAAIALRALGRASSPIEALGLAHSWWQARPRTW